MPRFLGKKAVRRQTKRRRSLDTRGLQPGNLIARLWWVLGLVLLVVTILAYTLAALYVFRHPPHADVLQHIVVTFAT